MRIGLKQFEAGRGGPSRRGEGGFTMIEIAMAIGIIGFALVAIIGILPTGLNVQKDNREDSIVNEDANFFIQAMRNGCAVTNMAGNTRQVMGRPFDFLTNYVDGIEISNSPSGQIFLYTNAGALMNFSKNPSQVSQGAAIIGLLTTPQYLTPDLAELDGTFRPETNYVRAWVRALSGAASEQNGSNSIVAFRYVLDMQVTPHSLFAYDATNFSDSTLTPQQYTNRMTRWIEARCLNRNLYDVQMNFHWPVVSGHGLGPNHQTFRTTVAGCLTSNLISANEYYYFRPQTFITTNFVQ